MTFTVTYRGKDGALREEAVEAADRAGCVAECRRRGISPTKIAEEGKGKGHDGARPRVGAAQDSKRTTARWVKLRREGDYEGAKAALDRYNAYLKSKGLPSIRMKTGPGRKKEEGQK